MPFLTMSRLASRFRHMSTRRFEPHDAPPISIVLPVFGSWVWVRMCSLHVHVQGGGAGRGMDPAIELIDERHGGWVRMWVWVRVRMWVWVRSIHDDQPAGRPARRR